jgi:hypothetical protein
MELKVVMTVEKQQEMVVILVVLLNQHFTVQQMVLQVHALNV